MAASSGQRQKAAEVLRSFGTQREAAKAAGVSVSAIKRWLKQPEFRAMITSSPDIRPIAPPKVGKRPEAPESRRDPRLRMWVAADNHEVLGSYVPPAAFESKGAVLHVHVVPATDADGVRASIAAGDYPAESSYIPVPLAGYDELLENLPLICRLGSADEIESFAAWLEVWTFIDEDGRNATLADRLWEGQRRFLDVLLNDRHVVSIKSRKVGLTTLVCAHAAWTSRIRDVNASVHLLSYREDAAQELLRALKRGFEGLPSFLRLSAERETSTVLAFSAGEGDKRSLKVFPATPNAAIEATASHLVLDEWAHTFDPEALWTAVEPTLSNRATSALITTARTPGDFVHDYWRRSAAGETRHTAVFVSALERSDRSAAWLEQKRREEGKARCLRNYPLTADEAFAAAGEPYFDPALVAEAPNDALEPMRARPGDRYVKAWDIGRKDATVCVVLRSPGPDDEKVWDVIDYSRLTAQDYPAIQAAIEAKHRDYPGPTVIEANSIGMPVIQNLNIPESEVIPYTTSQSSKQTMLNELELLLQKQVLKIHSQFHQLLDELANYRWPDTGIVQDSVMALGFAVVNRHRAHDVATAGRINRNLLNELNATYGPAGLPGGRFPWVTRL